MQKRISDMPPLLGAGVHSVTIEWIREHCVLAFPLSSSRQPILDGFMRLIRQLEAEKIPCDVIVDGSYFTEEIDPLDIDLSVCVTPEFYESCTISQLSTLEWIRDSFQIKTTHLCDAYLCVEYPEGHPDWYEGVQNRAFWVNLFSKSTIHKRIRGVGMLALKA